MKYSSTHGKPKKFKIDPEFKNLIPPLTLEEYAGLEKSILEEGCRDPLAVWGDTIVDGHNRYEICHRHNIPFDFHFLKFPVRRDAMAWIINNQLARRNLTPEQRNYLIGKQYQEKKRQGKRTDITLGQNGPKLNTAKEIGDQHKVGERTVKRAAAYTQALDTIAENVGEEARHKILSREARLTAKDVHLVADMEPEIQKAVLDEIFTYEAKNTADTRRLLQEEGHSNLNVHYKSETDEWCTPQEIIDRVLEVFPVIDLDPCSNSHDNPNVPAKKHYTSDDDGLLQQWHGRVYMNPPYGREVKNWVDKLLQSFENETISEAIVLVAARTDTKWFRKLIEFPSASVIWCAVEGRLSFSNSENSAPFPSAVVFLTQVQCREQDFYWAFKDTGLIYRKIEDGEMMQE